MRSAQRFVKIINGIKLDSDNKVRVEYNRYANLKNSMELLINPCRDPEIDEDEWCRKGWN